MAAETTHQEKDLLEAEQRGRREQLVDSRLDFHERRLDGINGQIARLASSLERTEHRVTELVAEVRTSQEVARALGRSAADAASKQVSRREFWLGVAAVVAVILAAIITTAVH